MNAGYLPRGLFAVVLGTDATDHRASISARAAIRIARSVPAETFLEVAKLELPSSLRRQWILTLILFLLTVGGSAYAFHKLPTTYQATSSVVFLTTKNAAKQYGNNPYLDFNTNLNSFADVVRYETMDVNTVQSLVGEGYTSTYQVTDATDTAGPVLNITVTGHNKASVEHTLTGVTNEISARASALQAGIATDNTIQPQVITFTANPTSLRSKKEKPLLVIVGLGLVVTIALPVIVDGQRTQRRRNNAGAPPGAADQQAAKVASGAGEPAASPAGGASRVVAPIQAQQSEDTITFPAIVDPRSSPRNGKDANARPESADEPATQVAAEPGKPVDSPAGRKLVRFGRTRT